MGAYRQAAPQILSTVEVDQSKSLLTQRQQSLIKSRTLFLLLLQIKALDWKATVGVGCNPLIASLDAFYARWKCTTGAAAALGRVPAWCVVHPYLPLRAPPPWSVSKCTTGAAAAPRKVPAWCAVHQYLPLRAPPPWSVRGLLGPRRHSPPISMTQLHH